LYSFESIDELHKYPNTNAVSTESQYGNTKVLQKEDST